MANMYSKQMQNKLSELSLPIPKLRVSLRM